MNNQCARCAGDINARVEHLYVDVDTDHEIMRVRGEVPRTGEYLKVLDSARGWKRLGFVNWVEWFLLDGGVAIAVVMVKVEKKDENDKDD